jgi:hypothetical protein
MAIGKRLEGVCHSHAYSRVAASAVRDSSSAWRTARLDVGERGGP